MKKKRRKARRPPKRASRTAASKPSGRIGGDTYSNFGELGPEFEGLKIKRWQIAQAEWKKLRAYEDRLLGDLPKSVSETFSQNISMARYFLMQLLVSSMRGVALKQKELRANVVELWDSVIQHCFAKPLGAASDVFGGKRIEERCGKIVWCYSGAVSRTDKSFELTKLCYGPFSQREMEYVVAHESHIIEAGCGAGYCLERFAEAGIDAVGFDANLYGLSDGQESSSTRALVDRGRILLADQSEVPDDFFHKRTLLISWPVSIDPYAAEVLKRYTDLGGQRFLLKFGGFLSFNGRSRLKTIADFFGTLHRSWKQVQGDDVPEYRTKMLENNLFVFERR